MKAHKGGDGEEMKKMKLRTVLCLALSLTFVFLSFPLTGCSAKGKTILSLGKHEITSNIYIIDNIWKIILLNIISY